jgi:hypothetical protein
MHVRVILEPFEDICAQIVQLAKLVERHILARVARWVKKGETWLGMGDMFGRHWGAEETKEVIPQCEIEYRCTCSACICFLSIKATL